MGKKWNISGLLPWPAVSYAPNGNEIIRLGATYSQSQWVTQNQNQNQNQSDIKTISRVNLGLSYERRLWNMIWGEVGAGYSGFGRFTVKSDGDLTFDQDISHTPFIKFNLNIRPESY